MNLWDDMTTLGVRPGVSLWTALIDSYHGVNDVDDALASWKMMRAQNIEPNALAYRAVISALFNGRKPDIALRIFREYQRDYQNSNPGDPEHNISVYNTVLHGLLLTDRIEEAKHLLHNMVDTGPSPDTVSYNTFLAYYSRRGNFKELANVVNDMANANLIGDVFSFSTILSALLKAGREDAPDVVFQLMQKQGIEPNVATYSAIIDHQMRAHDEQNIRAALLMLQKMELDARIHPNEVTYTSILAGLHRNRHLPDEKVQEWTRDIMRKMKERGVKFQLPTYHILLKACLSNPLPDGLQAAMKYYYELKKSKLRMTHTTWYILLAGMMQREEWTIADEIVKDMLEN
jgi:pentatricopeptide repeat protein